MQSWRIALWMSLVLFLWFGLPILAWGVDDIGAYFAHPARAGIHGLLAALLVVMLPVAIRRFRSGGWGSSGIPGKRVRRQAAVQWALVLCLLTILYATVRGDRADFARLPHAAEPLRYVGFVLFAASLALSLWASFALGKQLSHEVTIQEGHELVTSGPFRLVRHPKYLSGLVALAALALVYRSWAPLAGYALVLPLIFLRLHDEEGLLRNEFADAWGSYVARTWRLVPLIY